VSIEPDVNLRVAQLERESYENYLGKNYSKAIEQLKELAELNPAGKPGYYNNIGMCYLDGNNLTEAKKYFELSIESNGDFSTGMNNLGMVYEKMGNNTKAKEFFLKALEKNPANADAKRNLERLK
jgi:tetratricopeptide (TPR) repeat protein